MNERGYTQAFALLEQHEWMAGRREVWTSTHGRATRYHVMVDDGMAACRPSPWFRGGNGILLCESTLIYVGDVPGHMCCQRNGCRQLFEAYIA